MLHRLSKILRRFRSLRSEPAVSFSTAEERDQFRKLVGQTGERAAAEYLRRQGYRILERNFLARGGEVDIIAEDGGVIAFVEVKTRSPRAWATPESAVTPEKQARIRRAAARYLQDYVEPSPVRYDVVAVMTDEAGRVTEIRAEKNVFGDPPADAPAPDPVPVPAS